MGLFKLITKLRRKSRARIIQATRQTNSEAELVSNEYTSSTSPTTSRPATAHSQGFSDFHRDALATMAKDLANRPTTSSATDGVTDTAYSIVDPTNASIHNDGSLNLNLMADNLPEIPAPIRRPWSTPYNLNGYRMSRFYEHLHLDDAYEERSRRSRSAPAEMIRVWNAKAASSQNVEARAFPKPTGIERKDSKHKRNKSYPGYP